MEENKSDTKKCPYCGEEIKKSAKKCRFCGEFLTKREKEPVETNVKQGALIGSIVCIVLACLVMISSLWSFILYVPLLIAAFILSIVALAQKRILGGILTLLATLIVPPIVFVVMVNYNTSTSMDDFSSSTDQEVEVTNNVERDEDKIENEYIDKVKLTDFESKIYSSFLEDEVPGVKFKLENEGDSTLSMVQVTVFFKDKSGKTIYEDDFVAFNTESIVSEDSPLKPGYIWQMDDSEYYPAKNVPDEWEEGNATAKITDISFTNSE